MPNLPPESIPDAQKDALIAYLSEMISPERLEKMAAVLAQRTRYLTVVLENIYQPHNASAVTRSCECFGVQDVHIIEKDNRFRTAKTVALGATNWLTLHRHSETAPALTQLKAQGYQLAALTLREGSLPIDALPLKQKTALCFGEEMPGLSETAHDLADVYVQIPMVGFTQSFNISVTVALSLYALTQKIRTSPLEWGLSAAERRDLELIWLQRSLKHGDRVARHFLKAVATPNLKGLADR